MDTLASRRKVLQMVFYIIATVFVLRLLFIQVLNKNYKQLANNNVLRKVTLYPSRGLIYDRNGKLILFNQAEYDLLVVPGQIKKFDTLNLCNTLGLEISNFKKELFKAYKYSRFKPTVIVKGIQSELYAQLQEDLFLYPGFYAQVRMVRTYPIAAAAHVLGYISEVTLKQIDKSDGYYQQGDYIGTGGLEQYYEKILRGKKGVKYVLVDVHNREQGAFNEGQMDTLAIPGINLHSTLDIDLQQYGEKLMQGKVGSVVAIDPSTGEVLAMISSPTYDPRLITGRERGKIFSKLYADSLKPLFVRPLKASYPPGSIYKPLLGLIGLQEQAILPSSTYSCAGAYSVGSSRVGCHHSGFVNNIIEAIQHSCNAYFCMSFRKMVDNNKYKTVAQGLDSWKSYLSSFGIGVRMKTDLPGVGYGFIPGSDYYNEIYGVGHWNSLTIVSLGIGQGEIGLTPLQMANEMTAIANHGWFYTPHLVKKVDDDTSTVLKIFKEKNIIPIEKKWFDVTVEAMKEVVEAGTGQIAQIPGLTMGGKTGTAQNPHGKDHSLFICFSPVVDPKIAIAVIVENAGFGASYGAPIASLMIEKYLNDTISTPRKYLEQRMFEADLIHNKFQQTPVH